MASNNVDNYPNPSPQPSADHTTVIVVVFISFGSLFVLGAIFLCIWCLFKRHCKKQKMVRERKDVDFDEHLKVQELVLPGPHGPRTVVVSVEDDIRVHEDKHKDEVDKRGKGIMEDEASSVEGVAGSSHPDHQV